MQELLPAYEEQIINDSIQTGYDRYPEFFAAHAKNQQTISTKLEEPFRYFFTYLNGVSNIYATLKVVVNDPAFPRNHKFIFPLYGMCLRMADQVGTLLLNGYPDGALRIWRSLYEMAQTIILLMKHVDNAALQTKFVDHFHRSKRKKIESHNKHRKALKFRPIEQAELDNLAQRVEEFNAEFGNDFLDDEYGWCNDLFEQKKRVTLRDIEDHNGVTRFRPFYIWASDYTHPNFAAMMDFFEPGTQKLNLAEVDRQSLEPQTFLDPMQLTVAVLHEVNVSFLQIYSFRNEQHLNLELFRQIFEAMLASFDKAVPKSGENAT